MKTEKNSISYRVASNATWNIPFASLTVTQPRRMDQIRVWNIVGSSRLFSCNNISLQWINVLGKLSHECSIGNKSGEPAASTGVFY